MPRRSEPAPGSVIAIAPTSSPRTSARHPGPPLLVAAVVEHVVRRDLVHALAEAREARVQQLLVDDALEAEVAAEPAVLVGHVGAQQPGLPRARARARRRRSPAPASARRCGRISRSTQARAVSRNSSCSSLAQGERGRDGAGRGHARIIAAPAGRYDAKWHCAASAILRRTLDQDARDVTPVATLDAWYSGPVHRRAAALSARKPRQAVRQCTRRCADDPQPAPGRPRAGRHAARLRARRRRGARRAAGDRRCRQRGGADLRAAGRGRRSLRRRAGCARARAGRGRRHLRAQRARSTPSRFTALPGPAGRTRRSTRSTRPRRPRSSCAAAGARFLVTVPAARRAGARGGASRRASRRSSRSARPPETTPFEELLAPPGTPAPQAGDRARDATSSRCRSRAARPGSPRASC